MKQEKILQKKQEKQQWCVVHWLSGEVKLIGSKAACTKYAKRNSFNPESPIYIPIPVAGIILHNHKHEHVHKEVVHTKHKKK